MKRHAESYLIEWISSDRRKPLVLRGARQVGKTTLVRDFAKNNNLDLYEINLEQFPELADVFETRNMEKIIHALEFAIEKGSFIGKNKILFLDEIQATPAAIHTLRYFYENYPHIPVIAAGSLLEFALSEAKFSMPVGRIEFLYLEPMTFEEFLEASGKTQLLDLVRTFQIGDDFPITAHNLLLQHLRNYILVGGMPEAVLCFLEDGFQSVQSSHASILQTYQTDFSKYATKAELLRINKVFSYVPAGIGEKFKYVNVDPHEQARDLKVAFDLLAMARVIKPAWHIDGSGIPLGATLNERVFKPFFLDIGLVNASCGLTWISDEDFQSTNLINEGKLAEQYIAQHLHSLTPCNMEGPLTYWLREGRKNNAEVDFLIQLGTEILPMEIKSGKSGSLKSLHEFARTRQPERAIRFDLNLPSQQIVEVKPRAGANEHSIEFELHNFPLYLVEQLNRLIV